MSFSRGCRWMYPANVTLSSRSNCLHKKIMVKNTWMMGYPTNNGFEGPRTCEADCRLYGPLLRFGKCHTFPFSCLPWKWPLSHVNVYNSNTKSSLIEVIKMNRFDWTEAWKSLNASCFGQQSSCPTRTKGAKREVAQKQNTREDCLCSRHTCAHHDRVQTLLGGLVCSYWSVLIVDFVCWKVCLFLNELLANGRA